MSAFLHKLFSSFHFHITGVHPPKGFLETFLLLTVVLASGTVFYSEVEGWSYLDSLYFSVITITTVGYGDLHPTQPVSKLFTIFYIFIGMGLGIYVISTLAESIIEGRDKRKKRFEKVVQKITGN